MKLGIVVGAFCFIYFKITGNVHLHGNDFEAFIKETLVFSPKNLLILGVLSGLNWLFEILKWQQLVKTIKAIPFRLALEQSLASLTASLITPNRIGDYGAKALYFEKGTRTKIVLLNLLGHGAQMATTITLGLIGWILFVNRYSIKVDYFQPVVWVGFLILVGLMVIIGLKHIPFNIKGFALPSVFGFIKSISLKTHGINGLLSIIRYAVFSFQFYFLLRIFDVSMGYTDAMVIISSMYLLASILPTLSILDVVVKGSVAVFLFGFAQINELTVLTVTAVMWLLNFVIPSIVGSYYVLRFKLPRPLAKC